jgi:hypothetical protein
MKWEEGQCFIHRNQVCEWHRTEQVLHIIREDTLLSVSLPPDFQNLAFYCTLVFSGL